MLRGSLLLGRAFQFILQYVVGAWIEVPHMMLIKRSIKPDLMAL
jgi:hypothetical protein